MKPKLIAQGAEAKIILSNNFIIKDRIKKSYRLPELDKKIRIRRTRSESKLLNKAYKIIHVPLPSTILNNPVSNANEIHMPFIKGKKLSESLDNFSITKQKQICKTIGQEIAKLHDKDIIHGDLTTSNMILKNKDIFFIDFGLGYISKKIEDKAVDIHLLKQALEAKHFKNWEILFNEFLKGYNPSKNSEKVFIQLKKIEKRGRYRH